ncbi:MAG: DUF2889 domain-containing protein [Burkholderiales bacterium]
MPLSVSAARQLIHRRRIECCGYHRDDGLWDIEGHLVDTKTRDVSNLDRANIPAGEPIHEMWLRLTLTLDMKVVNAEASTEWGPYEMCDNITPNFNVLIGETIKPGWIQRTRELLGGTRGCTHLVELLGPIATTAFQTIHSARMERDRQSGINKRPALIDSCHAWASDSAMIKKRYPEYYTGNRVTGANK